MGRGAPVVESQYLCQTDSHPLLNKEQKHNWYIATCFPLYASQCWGKKLIIQEEDQQGGRQSAWASSPSPSPSASSPGRDWRCWNVASLVSRGRGFIIKVRSITIHSNLSAVWPKHTELNMGSQEQTQITMRRRLTVFFSNHHQHPCHERSLPFLAIQKLHFYISLCNMSGNRQSILTLVSFKQKNVCDFGKLRVNIRTRNQIFWAV